jgi:hypothetical protein
MPGTSVIKVGSMEFTVTFHHLDLRYHLRTTSTKERDMWCSLLNEMIAFVTNLADLRVDDSAVAAAATGQLRLLLSDCKIDAFQSAALDENVLSAFVRLLSSPALSIGNDCAACLGHLAAYFEMRNSAECVCRTAV